MAIKTIRVFAEYTSDGYVPMPSQGNIDYGITLGSTFPETQPSSFQTDDPNIDVAVTTMTDYYVWIRTHGSSWNPSYTRVVRIYPDSPSINSVVMNMIVAVGSGGTSIGGGSGVSYYLNGGTSQGVLDGSTYYEMNKVPVEGTGVDFFKIHTSGFENIAQFVTDAGDPGLLNIPAGNWPLGFYFSASNNTGNPSFYAEIYKYSAAGVFTLLGSGVANPEVITNGQAIDFYTSNVAMPETTLLVTDRIAVRIFVNTDGNRTINLHTQDSHLSTVGTTFTRGLTAINGLIKQVQFIAIGNAGSDVSIVSDNDTHTLNLPTASSTKRGLLSGTDWATFNAKQPALSGDGFVKISGSTISYDNSTYQPLDGDLTAIGALAGTSGILKKTGANTWELDTITYLSTGVAASTYQRLDKMVSNLLASDTEYPNSNAVLAALALKANKENPEFTGSMNIVGDESRVNFYDQNSVRKFFIGYDTGYLRIYQDAGSTSRFYINSDGKTFIPGVLEVGSVIKTGGTASQFLKANGTVDSTEYATTGSLADYLLSATAVDTYQRKDNLSTNLLASATKYPNNNAVIAELALKADAANPQFTGSMNIKGAESRVNFYDENDLRKYFIGYEGGTLRIYQDAGSASRFYINSTGKTFIPGTLEVGTIIKTSGTASEFLKADGSVDSSTYVSSTALADYLLSATATSTYQRLDRMAINLLASDIQYPNNNAVIAALALKANAANPTFTGNFTISGAEPKLYFVDTDNNPDYTLGADAGYFTIYDQTAGATRFSINSSGNATFNGDVEIALSKNLLVSGDLRFTGSDSYIWSPNVSGGYTGLYDPFSGKQVINYVNGGDLELQPVSGNVSIGGILRFPNVVGNKIDFYHTTASTGDRYGIQVQSSELRIHSGAAGDSAGGITFGKSTTTTFTEAMRLTNAGNLLFNPSGNNAKYIYINQGTGFDGSLIFQRAGANKWQQSIIGDATDSMSFYSYWLGAVAFQIKHNGNVLIGTTTDGGYKLDVDGIVRIKGNYLSFNDNGYIRGDEAGVLSLQSGSSGFKVKNYGNNLTYLNIANSTGAAVFYSSIQASTGYINGDASSSLYHGSKFAVGGKLFLPAASNSDIGGTIYGYQDSSVQTYEGGLKIQSFKHNGTGYAMADSVTINGRGFVGLGTTTPLSKLQIVGLATSENGLFITTTGTGNDYYAIKVGTGTSTDVFSVTNAGRVGIGTLSPTYKFEVSDGTRTGVFNPNATLDGFFLGTKEAKPLILGTSDAQVMRLTSVGAVLINSETAVSGRISAKSLQITNEVYSRGTSGGFFWEDRSNTANWYGWYTSGAVVKLWNGSTNILNIEGSNGNTTFPGSVKLGKHSYTDFIYRTLYIGARQYDSNYSIINMNPYNGDYNYGFDLGVFDNGTSGNQYFWIGDNRNTEYFRINSSGKVGIGTNNPTERLHIYSSNTTGEIRLGGGNGAGNARMYFQAHATTAYIDMYGNNQYLPLQINASKVNFMAGYIGVNTTTPEAYIHINGSSYGTGLLITTSSDSGADITLTNTGAGGKRWDITSGGSNNGIGAGGLQFYNNTDGAMRMGITSAGNVLIGTSIDNGAKFRVHYDGGNGSVGLSSYNILATTGSTSSVYQATIGAIHPGDGYGNLNLGGNGVFWHISKRLSSNDNQLEYYYYNGTSFISRFIFSTGGNLTASAFYESSDSRLKDLLQDDVQIKNIENLKAKFYLKEGKQEYGYFAQEAETYMPSAVTRNSNGYLNLSYREVHTVKIARLEQRVAELEKQLNVA
jgi:hypothetical protein